MAPSISQAEPAPDRLRESVLAILQHMVPGSRILDLFACSGSFGIEALSRGAEYVLFVDTAPESVETIRRNLENLGISDKTEVKRGNAFNVPETVKSSRFPSQFDIVFIDPPYPLSDDEEGFRRILGLIKELFLSGVVDEDGLVFFRQRKSAAYRDYTMDGLAVDVRDYGTARVTFFERDQA